MASVVVAYVLWFFFGIFGVHHFYLKRDRHAFVWWSTLGGLFGLGWIRDFWRIPDYVKEANEDEDSYVSDNDSYYACRGASREGTPKLSLVRLGGMVVMGYVFGNLVMFACPQEWLCMFDRHVWWFRKSSLSTLVHVLLRTCAVSLGVHLVACIGRVQASFKWCLTGSFVGDLWLKFNPSTTETSCLLSATAVNLFGISWKPPVRPYRSKRARFFVLFVCGTIYLLLWTTSVYFNVIANDVETVPLKRVIDAYFTSAVWPVVRERIHRAWHHLNDWWLRFRRIEELIPPDGGSPHEILGVSESASVREIKEQYRKLVKKWHPDKQRDPALKKKAHEIFIKIQNAYETLLRATPKT